MNKPRLDNITQWKGLKIPYLNGGLFDQSRDPQTRIILTDSVFDIHEGVLGFFNRYNFTVADDTPLEQDVAVDLILFSINSTLIICEGFLTTMAKSCSCTLFKSSLKDSNVLRTSHYFHYLHFPPIYTTKQSDFTIQHKYC
jgi:hypothetical protein